MAGFGTGGSTNLEAGLAAAVAASPDLTVVVTDGVANTSSGAGGHGGHPTVAVQDEAVHFAVAHADQLKAAGSRVFAVGVGNVDTSMLAAISGPSAGGDVASADYSLGGADAIAASLHTVASAGCAPSTAEEPGDFAVARAVGGFCNTNPIAVPATGTFGIAAPYPSTITVSGADPVAGLVTVQLAGVGHTTPVDFDMLLVGPTGANVILLSDAGGFVDVTGADLTFVDNAPAAGAPLVTGTYRPTNLGAATDSWPAPAPAPSGATTLATFSDPDPNGVWSLFVVDDEHVDVGTIAGGWCLTVFSDVATAVTTATAVTSAPNPSLAGEEVTFTATVTSGGNPVTAGTVTFSDATTGDDIAADVPLDAQGVAAFTTGDLAPGSHVITATYDGHHRVPPEPGQDRPERRQPGGVIVQRTDHRARLRRRHPVPVDPHHQRNRFGDDAGHRPPRRRHPHLPPRPRCPARRAHRRQRHRDERHRPGGADANGVTLTFSDFAQAAPVASVTGTYLPTNGSGSDPLPAPAPPASGATALATFNGTNPNGTWSLYVFDDAADDGGSMAGWCLFVATAIAPTETTLTSSPNPSTFEQPVTFTATVTSEGNPVTEGTVTFTDATTAEVLAADVPVDAQGQATTATSTLTVGDHEIIASYSGALEFAASEAAVTHTVEVIADAGGPYTIGEGDALTLDASASVAGPTATYTWDVNDDGTFGDATGATPTLTWAALEVLGITNGGGGAQPITVQVTEASSTSTAETTLTVTNTRPTVTIDGPSTAVVGVPVTLKVGAEDPSSSDMAGTFTYTVNWGDGTPAVTVDGPSDPPITHTYTAAGTYTGSATATDPDGATSDPLPFTITASPSPNKR